MAVGVCPVPSLLIEADRYSRIQSQSKSEAAISRAPDPAPRYVGNNSA
jgi:hypothetical protein